jgi:hypothetical protein
MLASFLAFLVFETSLAMWPRLALNSPPSCCIPPNAGIIDMYYYPQLHTGIFNSQICQVPSCHKASEEATPMTQDASLPLTAQLPQSYCTWAQQSCPSLSPSLGGRYHHMVSENYAHLLCCNHQSHNLHLSAQLFDYNLPFPTHCKSGSLFVVNYCKSAKLTTIVPGLY